MSVRDIEDQFEQENIRVPYRILSTLSPRLLARDPIDCLVSFKHNSEKIHVSALDNVTEPHRARDISQVLYN